MKKIAMVNCLNAGEICAATGCMTAFNDRKASFAPYGDEELRLTAFMRCNGCGKDPLTDKGTIGKVDWIVKEKTDVVHFGACTKNMQSGQECETIGKIAGMFEEAGIAVVRGTH